MNLLPDLLKDTGETDAAPEPECSPEELAHDAHETATVAWVKRYVCHTCSLCWAKAWVRRWRIVFIFGLGVMTAAQVGGAMWIRSMIEARDAILERTMRRTIREVLTEQKVISATPSPAAGDSVASLLGGNP
jgi:hypothetical protein